MQSLCQQMLLCAAAVLAVGRVHADDLPSPSMMKLAIVDVSAESPLPAAFVDLLFANIANEKAIELLERKEIARILAEQKSSAAFENFEESLRIGKLLAADVVLILQRAPATAVKSTETSGDGIQVRLRIVETRQGIKFSDAVIPWSVRRAEADLAVITRHVHKQLQRIRTSMDGVTLLAVGDFRSRDISRHVDWLSPALTTRLELRLTDQPGVVLMERCQVRPLIQERSLTIDQLPAALRGATVRIEGEFWLETKSPEVLIHTLVCCRHPGVDVVSKEVTAPFSHPEELCEAVAAAAVDLLGLQTSATEFDSKLEASLLADEGERRLKLQERQAAAQSLLAAYALDPESFRIQVLLLNAGCPEIDFRVWGQETLQGERHEQFRQEIVPLLWLLTEVAQKVLQHPEFPHHPDAKWDPIFHFESILSQIGRCQHQMWFLSKYLDTSKDNVFEEMEALRDRMSLVAVRLRDLTAPYRNEVRGTYASIYLAACGSWWQKTPELALAENRRVLELGMTEREWFLPRTMRASYFELDRIPAFHRRSDLHEVYLRYLDELARSEHAHLRAESLRARVNYCKHQLHDPVKGREYYFQYIDKMVTEVIPQYPELDETIHTLVGNLGGVNVLGLPPEDIAASYCRLIRAAIPRALRRNPQGWEHMLLKTYQAYEKVGDVVAADQLLTEFIDALDQMQSQHHDKNLGPKIRGWRDVLREDHPDILKGEDSLRKEQPRVRTLLQVADLKPHLLPGMFTPQLQFHGMIETSGSLGVVVRQQTEGRIGIVRFVLQSGTITQASFSNVPLERGICSTASIGEEIFVGHSRAGLFHFRPGMPVIHYSRKHASEQNDRQRPFPADEISQVVTTKDRVYARLDTSQGEYGLIELDPTSGESHVLFSRRASPDQHPFSGLKERGNTNGLNGPKLEEMAAADDGTLLVAISGGVYGDLRGLFRTWPGTSKVERLQENTGHYYRKSGDRLLAENYYHNGAYLLDTQSGQFSWLLDSGDSVPKETPPWKFNFSMGKFEARNGHLVAFGIRPGRRTLELLHFRPGESLPTLLTGPGIPEFPKNYSGQHPQHLLWPADSGLLLLTPEALSEIEFADQ